MKKLSLLVVPVGILFSGLSYAPEAPTGTASQASAELSTISSHLSSLELQAPANLAFAGQSIPLDRPDVARRLNRQLRSAQYYYATNMLMHKRAARYREVFQRILRQHGVPEDFFYLAVAESNLSNAISPVGAKGFWQFMPATAREYGLEVSATVDERYHPEKAAHAAAYYLKDAYERFGDWTLVAASYNMGQAGVSRQVRRQDTADYFALKLNSETSQYLYRILHYKVLLEHPQLFGLRLSEAEMYEPITYRVVEVNTNIPSLASFAKEHGTTEENLKRLNPWLVANSLYGRKDKVYEIRIPVSQDFIASELEIRQYHYAIPDEAKDIDAGTDSTQKDPAPIVVEFDSIGNPMRLDSVMLETTEGIES